MLRHIRFVNDIVSLRRPNHFIATTLMLPRRHACRYAAAANTLFEERVAHARELAFECASSVMMSAQ